MHRKHARTSHRLLKTALGALSGLALLGGGLYGLASADEPSTPGGMSLIWSDGFSGAAGTLPSSNNWIIDTGTSYPGGAANWGTGETQTYTSDPANLQQDGDGNLKITPIKDDAGNWTSARIETQRSDFEPPAGGKLRIEARIQVPDVTGDAAQGYWPAFWTLGAPFRGTYTNWPGIGEFDIMENANGANKVSGTLHCGTSPGGPCNENTGIGASRDCPDTACAGNFHTYALEWDRSTSPQELRWYVDGVQYHSVNSSQVDANTWDAATGHAHFLLLNLAMGGAFPDAAAAATTPTSTTESGKSMLVDYVAVYSSDSTAGTAAK
ncbi:MULTISPECIES: glycoside hydrolase family 16 protein [unclassified Streptomyces]|uniref:glycoside hydrolase family 16 protein n=1 Tax=unclassified Streptomyces TaxID=2593676 RepID=UPI002B1D1229|nr:MULTISPECIES: glycoside hydrolase family 16 protein [unclassified Streptomyces]